MNQSLLVFLVFISALAIGLILLQVMFGTGANIGDRLVAPTDSLAAAGALPSWLLGSSNLLRWNAQRLRQNKGQNAKVEKLQNALTNAGYRGVEAVALFQLTRAAVMIAAVLFGCALGLWTGAHLLLFAVAGGLAGYAIPMFLLGWYVRRRQRRLVKELPDVLSLMVVSLEAGVGVSEVIKIVGRETERQGRLLGHELSASSAQMATGMNLEDALRDLSQRTGVDVIQSLVALLIQSEQAGARLGPTLRASADLLSSRRRLAAQEMARKAAVKILIPLVLFILPALMLVMLGPAAIQLMMIFGQK